ncbi:MAG: LPS export ABC transporter permease LptG [SAR86 cluster bacterium]|uniref:LPS export ABC transporter permease LptG n=1 Tax=SAR86 cluster bacterium TaxID=2030880 RepID=A0A2A5AUE2_9GAMM|nr:MAG: LPS export ABC transporter permease LptG [SAR86 cluster bacterium]
MRKIDSHIRSTVLLSMLVVISLIVTVDLVFTLSEEMSSTDENYSALNALAFVLFTTPTSIYELLPFTALGGALIGLGILASNNELVVMQAAGVTVWRIVWAVLKPTLFIMLLSLLLGEFIAPPLEQIAQSNKAVQKSGNASISSAQGSWRKVGDEYIHINAIAPGGQSLFGITRYRLGLNRSIVSSSFAESAEYIEQNEENYWLLQNVSESLIQPGAITAAQNPQEIWRVDLSPELLAVLLVEPDRQSISGLYRFARFFEAEGLDPATYYLAFWKKLLQPIATLALVVLAVSFVFGPLRESTMGFRVFVSMGIALAFTITQRMMEPASLLYGFSPLIAVLIPIMFCAALGLYFMRRVR